jgi:hypothetical protein
VRCPGHAIHFIEFGYKEYDEYVRRVLKLGGVNFESVVKGVKKHGSWNPWNPNRQQGAKRLIQKQPDKQ